MVKLEASQIASIWTLIKSFVIKSELNGISMRPNCKNHNYVNQKTSDEKIEFFLTVS